MLFIFIRSKNVRNSSKFNIFLWWKFWLHSAEKKFKIPSQFNLKCTLYSVHSILASSFSVEWQRKSSFETNRSWLLFKSKHTMKKGVRVCRTIYCLHSIHLYSIRCAIWTAHNRYKIHSQAFDNKLLQNKKEEI